MENLESPYLSLFGLRTGIPHLLKLSQAYPRGYAKKIYLEHSAFKAFRIVNQNIVGRSAPSMAPGEEQVLPGGGFEGQGPTG